MASARSRSVDRGESAQEIILCAAETSGLSAQTKLHSIRNLVPLIVLLAAALSGCGDTCDNIEQIADYRF